MRIDLCFTPNQADELTLRDKTVVVIDVLRASTSIVIALRNGAREIIPATTVESAMKISGNLAGNMILLGGERNGKRIEGFTLGNSPLEYTEERVRGKAIIFTSTNGSQAIVRARYAQELVVCGFINISAVADFLRERPRDVVIVCAGRNGMFSMEDTVCGGMLLSRIVDETAAETSLSDGAMAAMVLSRNFGKGLLKMMKSTEHGRYLEGIGFGEDLKVSAAVDSVPVLPMLEGNVLRRRREIEKREPVPQTVTS